jgi:hypothetical protein
MRQTSHEVDLCVVGGGMAGLTSALAAARYGARVILMHDRPVLGGNASSECRVHICGADIHNTNPNLRETGILEELRLENLARNPNKNYSVWDTLLYEKAMAEPNLTLLLNCTCQSVEMNDHIIKSVTGWQLTTETTHTVRAKLFADCSGDAILAPLSGAEFRMGREARTEYGESIAPEIADKRTMGMTCLFQSREYATPQLFEALPWANRYEHCEDLPYGAEEHAFWQMGYWWVELGGEYDTIHDTERLRDELLKIAYGVWDHIKNRCPNRKAAENWSLEWVQFLPAKRESRRYLGAHVLTQNDIEAGGRFDDIVAYGGWSMDDHHPLGFNAVNVGAPATLFHHAPSPYGIPYRSLYSRNIQNLMFAGRNASCTHTAMSSTRVMGTGCSMGQALGVAAAMSLRKDVLPSGMLNHVKELQQTLLFDDAYLPGIKQDFSSITRSSVLLTSRGNPESLRDGLNRPIDEDTHAWEARPGDWVAYVFASMLWVETITLILDSALEKNIQMSCHQKDDQLTALPDTLPESFIVEGFLDNRWFTLSEVTNNRQRLIRLKVGQMLEHVRYTLRRTHGAESSRMFAFYCT